MKLLIVNDILQGGGVEKLMFDIVMYFHTQYEITILTNNKESNFTSIYPEDVHYLYETEHPYPKTDNRLKRKIQDFQMKHNEKKFRNKIEKMNFDVMLCMKEGWVMFMAMKYCQSIPCKIGWNHTDYSRSYYTKICFGSEENEVNYMRKFDKIVCVSKVIKENIIDTIGDPGNLVVLYNPIDKDEIIKKSLEPVEDISRHKELLFVTVGRLNTQKGYDILLEVCNLLNAEGYKYDVWIIGGGEAWNQYAVLHELEEKIFEYKLDNVYLLGEKSNPYKYVKQGDWFLSTSRYEGYSYVSQEAALLKKPLMLTACSGVMELLQSEKNGVVLENSFKGIYLGMRDAIIHSDMYRDYEGKITFKDSCCYKEDRLKAIEALWRK